MWHNAGKILGGGGGLFLVGLPLLLATVAGFRIAAVRRGGASPTTWVLSTVLVALGVPFVLVAITGVDVSIGGGDDVLGRTFGFPFRHLVVALLVWSVVTAIALGAWIRSRLSSPGGRRRPRLAPILAVASVLNGVGAGLVVIDRIDDARREAAGADPQSDVDVDETDYTGTPGLTALGFAWPGCYLAPWAAIAVANTGRAGRRRPLDEPPPAPGRVAGAGPGPWPPPVGPPSGGPPPLPYVTTTPVRSSGEGG